MPISERAPTRRALLATGLAAILGTALTGLAGPAAANPAARAQTLVTQISAELTQVLRSGRGEAQVYGDFERILARHGDMPAVAASVLGPPWRSLTPAQKGAFVTAFQSYLARKYGRQLREFQDARIEVTGARDAGRAGVLVTTRVLRPGREPVAVDWQISERAGSPRAVNLIIEGVSMLANERAEVGAMLEAQGGNVDALIARMAGRA